MQPALSPRDATISLSSSSPQISWRECPNLTLKAAAAVSGLSISTLYRLAAEGRLKFRRLAGRVLVETTGLIALIDGAEDWQPSDRGKEARAKRAEIARSNWRS